MWLIVGLGNPGEKYELTRHNLGFLAIDALVDRLGESINRKGFLGKFARLDIDKIPAVALKPETFMNRSGPSVEQAMSFHKIPLQQVIVFHDEIDLPLGHIRIKCGGSSGGHNGLKDITRVLGPDFIRIRLGIGRPLHKGQEADFVLAPFLEREWPTVEAMLLPAAEAVRAIVAHGLDYAQQRCQIQAQKN